MMIMVLLMLLMMMLLMMLLLMMLLLNVDLPEEQGRAEAQFRGSVEPAPDWEFLAPKRKHCCNLAVGVSIFENRLL